MELSVTVAAGCRWSSNRGASFELGAGSCSHNGPCAARRPRDRLRWAYDAFTVEVVTRYARSGDLQIAYQVVGKGPPDAMVVPRWFSNIELDWELPPQARFLGELASFARVVQFDRRGAGMSSGVAGATPLEDQIDDVRAVLEAAACQQPVLISIAEGCALAVLFAASHPDLVRALVLISPTPRVVRGPGYEWAQTVQERAAMVRDVVEYWGSSSPNSRGERSPVRTSSGDVCSRVTGACR